SFPERAQRTNVFRCGCAMLSFGIVVTEVFGVVFTEEGSLFEDPLSRMMFFGPSNCGRTITFGLPVLIPTVPPTGMRPVEPLPFEPLPVVPPPGLPAGLPSPPPVTGPLIGGLSIGMLLDGLPVMQRRNSAPLSLAQGSLFPVIG